MSPRTTNQPRQPRGVPVGRQWLATARPAGPALALPKNRSAYDLALAALRWADLPDNFDWSVTDGRGRTIAHEAAKQGILPPGFSRWELADEDGWTVAHTAAQCGHLPPDFERWDLVPECYRP